MATAAVTFARLAIKLEAHIIIRDLRARLRVTELCDSDSND